MRPLLVVSAIVIALCCSALPATAQKNACMPCTELCKKCGWTNKCISTCLSNGNPSVTGPCKDWFDSCKKK